MLWRGQSEFLLADTKVSGMFTGAGYGKTKVLCQRALKDQSAQDGWWLSPLAGDWSHNHIKIIMGAPHDRYLVTRLIPGFRGEISWIESLVGRKLRGDTGRGRDGWFGASNEKKQEMRNACDFLFYPLHSPESAVATDAAGLYIDEVTMIKDVETWNRSVMRIRDPRANILRIACVGTPEEDHFIKDIMIDPETGLARAGYTVVTDSSINNPVLSLDYFEQIGLESSEAFVKMQVMGEWCTGLGGQRFAGVWDQNEHVRRMEITPHTPGIKFHMGWDPGYRLGAVVIMYRHPRDFWCIVDQVVIRDMTTREVCEEIKRRGYNKHNIEFIGMDPRDATKRRSNSRVTDFEIIYEELGIKPRKRVGPGAKDAVRVRCDAIAQLLKDNRLFVNEAIKPRNSSEIGVINSIKLFATRKMRSDEDNFSDYITAETKEKWKHFIDALGYVFSYFEAAIYRQVFRRRKRGG